MFWKKWFENKKDTEFVQNLEAHLDVKAIVLTDIGNVRSNNEDRALFIRPSTDLERSEKGFLAILADGMGGHNSGEIASSLAVETITKKYYRDKGSGIQLLLKSFQEANLNIYNSALKNSRNKGMGTTCSGVLIKKDYISIVHVGDSRIYLLQENILMQISEDHTYVMDLYKNGVISADEINTHPEKNILTRALGTKLEIEFQCETLKQTPNTIQKILICSDGLYDYINQQEIQDLLLTLSTSDSANQLIQLAKQRGGHDNITLVLIEFVSKEPNLELKETKSFD